MNTDSMQEVLDVYGLTGAKPEAFGSGLVNRTWKVCAGGKKYILQKINEHVFNRPQDIAYNIRLIGDYLKDNYPGYFFVHPVVSIKRNDIVFLEEAGWFRLFPFIEGSQTINVVTLPEQAYEAALQFGKFSKLLSAFDAGNLKITIPQFHNLELRYQQFLQAIVNGNQQRKIQAKKLIEQLMNHNNIVDEYRGICKNPEFKLRVMHHDTKISNVLFDEKQHAICVIDLDTIMPGFFISDVGDMIRTYVPTVSEEEKDLTKLEVRREIYSSIVKGYYHEMNDELTPTEKNYFFYAGKCMVYMQALRFLTDYLNNDKYYGAKYPENNLVRAKNQSTLLKLLIKNENNLCHPV